MLKVAKLILLYIKRWTQLTVQVPLPPAPLAQMVEAMMMLLP